MTSNYFNLCRFLLLPLSIIPSIRVFSNESVLRIRWPNIGVSASKSSPSNQYSGKISFRIDWFDLLVVQGSFKSFLQHSSTKASILQHSAFFMVQLSHPFMANKWGNNGKSESLYLLGLQNQMATAAMKLKDACSLKEKL